MSSEGARVGAFQAEEGGEGLLLGLQTQPGPALRTALGHPALPSPVSPPEEPA